MGRRQFQRQPPKSREPKKPEEEGRKTLEEACRDIKVELVEKERLRQQALDEERRRPEYEALMASVYGPNWRVTPPDEK